MKRAIIVLELAKVEPSAGSERKLIFSDTKMLIGKAQKWEE